MAKQRNLFELLNNTSQGTRKQEMTQHSFPEKEKQYLECYTDGGCYNSGRHKGIGGWGFFINNKIFPFYDYKLQKEIKTTFAASGGSYSTTNNEMEMTALDKLMDFLIMNELNQEQIKVYIDSAYVVNCFNEGWYATWQLNGWKNANNEPVKNANLWRVLLSKYNHFSDIEFIHIRGHVGIYGNEICDKLCKQQMTKLVAGKGGYIVK